jgi:hypothetical protein
MLGWRPPAGCFKDVIVLNGSATPVWAIGESRLRTRKQVHGGFIDSGVLSQADLAKGATDDRRGPDDGAVGRANASIENAHIRQRYGKAKDDDDTRSSPPRLVPMPSPAP